MCGICGYYSFSSKYFRDQNILKRMNNELEHRGPDDQGYYVKGNVGLGMRRLSVIDLFTGLQPIHNEDHSIWVVFNGEIYNYKSLRNELELKGHKFYTNSDTETIVHLYEEYKEDFLNKLNGMFAIALWDENNQRLILARDRLGIKPLYYSENRNRILFASEIKALLQAPDISKDINPKALDYYFTFLSIPSPDSIFKDIQKLQAGHYLVADKSGITIQKYWEKLPCPISNDKKDLGKEYYVNGVREILEDSVKLRLMSDVPVGAFLSGGLDSSTIVALMSKLTNSQVKTFSIGFEEEDANELDFTRKIAEFYQTDHHEFIVKPDIVQLLDELVWYFDEPFAVSSALPTYLLSKNAKNHVTVALTGDGADELFAGYPRYWWDKTASYYNILPGIIRKRVIWPFFRSLPSSTNSPILNKIRKAKKFIKLGNLSSSNQYLQYLTFFDRESKDKLFSDDYKAEVSRIDPMDVFNEYLIDVEKNDLLSQRLYLDMKTSLPDEMLMKVDRMSMAASLEARTPFLDYRLVEFSMDIPSKFKLNQNTLKYVLKCAVSGLVPDEIINRKKHGFHVPIDDWFRKQLKSFCYDVLSADNLKHHGLFDSNYVENLIKIHLEGKENLGHHLWSLIVFNLWYHRVVS